MTNYITGYWRNLLNDEASDLPVERLLAWIGMESAGFPQALGACTEVGIFQIDVQDGPKYGGSQATLHANFCAAPCSSQRVRDLTPDEERLQVTSGVGMVRDYLNRSQNLLSSHGLDWDDDGVWCLVKLHHALPVIPAYILPAAANNGQASSYDDFRAYALGLSVEEVNAITHGDRSRYYPLTRFFDNCEKVGHASGIVNTLPSALGLDGFIDPLLALGVAAGLGALYVLSKLLGGVAV